VADRRPLGFGRHSQPDAATETPGAAHGAAELDDESMARLLPQRDARGHKRTFGKVLVVAGSLDYAGAALLVCRAAGRAGAGLVTLAVPESLQPLFAAKVVEATTMALPEDDVEEVDPEPALAKILDNEHDALVIGPGLRPALATADLLRLVLTAPEEPTSPPVVLDAEALRTLASADEWWSSVTRPCILTPHVGEFRRLRAGAGHDPAEDGDLLADDAARVRAATAAAVEWRQVVVLKGAKTVVASPDGSAGVAPFENPAMASGGTGDVLSGTIGALLAQGLTPFDAARLGVYLHGLAGEAVRDRIGDAGLLAGDLPDAIPMARKRLAAIAERQRNGRRLGFGARETPASPAAPAPSTSDGASG
jgi:NAD(P)H-hydrate epimerase